VQCQRRRKVFEMAAAKRKNRKRGRPSLPTAGASGLRRVW
jgi:hypothetical protein